ncbi:zinc ribbon domain-containing protein [Arthrobacter sp. ISL-28]|uniref:zinc ribbon domain-containing protein n=1 Tax=Arthrobacter sp. ISL-28 TaxID=2819108 RepID=UPI001BE633BE|nr:zinc ribbon domain-containing protein [Arthrobacter sp. ISL-28]MBT2519768.1 hypothetical protein [Arthrobacter sp. ISL-28]
MSNPTGADAPTEKIAAQDKQPEPAASTDQTTESVEFEEPPAKVCPKCSVQTQTAGNFCPHCGAAYTRQRQIPKLSKRVILSAVGALIIAIAGLAIALSIQHNNQVNSEMAAAAAAAEAQQEREAEEARASAAASASAAAKEEADSAERVKRTAIVTALEESVLKDAKSRVDKGVLDGPITRASCTPLGGGSTDDLTAITGTFECIAVNKTEADGSESGYRFSATANWNEASYSWHLGS